MKTAMALRLDTSTRNRIARIAKRRSQTASEVVRQAIASLVEREEALGQASPYETIADLIGSVRGSDPGRSAGGGRRVSEMLRRRRNAS